MSSIRKINLVTLLLGGIIGWSVSTIQVFQSSTAQEGEIKVAAAVDDAANEEIERPVETLDWMTGSWSNDSADSKISFSCRYTKNNAFMIRSFKSGDGETAMSGMQVVAWDPAKQAMRSWTFDSDGGFGQGIWSQSDDRYTIRTTYTLPDGGVAAAMNVMTYVDSDTFTWRSVNREIDGEMQPDIDEITLVRADAVQPAGNDKTDTDTTASDESDAKAPTTAGENQ